jgi:hypothetical protein
MSSNVSQNRAMAATTSQRFEAKYLIDENKACAVGEFIQPFVSADAHGREYLVGTTYLDSPDLRLYRGSVQGEKNRFKLRVRSYRANGNGHVYLEIKRRLDQIIMKERVSIQTDHADEYLLAPITPEVGPVSENAKDVLALHNFCSLRDCLMAVPRVDITYDREAYMSGFGENVRITFDRNIKCLPVSTYAEIREFAETPQVPVVTNSVVLEIKFTDRCPSWVGKIIQRFDLQRRSVSKYVMSVDALKRRGFHVGESHGEIYS